jgi:WD40 repeat protein
LAQALRLNQRNYEAAALIVTLLAQTSWPLPVGGLMRHDSAIESVQFSPDGQQVVTASADGTARLWDAASGEQRGQPMKHEKADPLGRGRTDALAGRTNKYSGRGSDR